MQAQYARRSVNERGRDMERDRCYSSWLSGMQHAAPEIEPTEAVYTLRAHGSLVPNSVFVVPENITLVTLCRRHDQVEETEQTAISLKSVMGMPMTSCYGPGSVMQDLSLNFIPVFLEPGSANTDSNARGAQSWGGVIRYNEQPHRGSVREGRAWRDVMNYHNVRNHALKYHDSSFFAVDDLVREDPQGLAEHNPHIYLSDIARKARDVSQTHGLPILLIVKSCRSGESHIPEVAHCGRYTASVLRQKSQPRTPAPQRPGERRALPKPPPKKRALPPGPPDPFVNLPSVLTLLRARQLPPTALLNVAEWHVQWVIPFDYQLLCDVIEVFDSPDGSTSKMRPPRAAVRVVDERRGKRQRTVEQPDSSSDSSSSGSSSHYQGGQHGASSTAHKSSAIVSEHRRRLAALTGGAKNVRR
jgi:hypothetical protein